jgi:hypothetical protein
VQYSKSTSSVVVEEDKMSRAVLMRNRIKVSLSHGEKQDEKRFSWNPTLQSAGSSLMSVVEVDKLASAVLIRNRSNGWISKPIPNCFMFGDDVNIDKTAPICDCTVSAGNFVLYIAHSERNNDRKYYHCRKPVGNHCYYFKWAD